MFNVIYFSLDLSHMTRYLFLMLKPYMSDTRDLDLCSTIVQGLEQAHVFACVKLWKQSASDNLRFNLPVEKLFFQQACYCVYNGFLYDGLRGIINVSCLFHLFVNGIHGESVDSHIGLQVMRNHASKKEGYDSAFLALRFDSHNWLASVVIPALLFKVSYPYACPHFVNGNAKAIYSEIVKHWELITGIASRGAPREIMPHYQNMRNVLSHSLDIPTFKGNDLKRPMKGIGKLAYALHKENCLQIMPPLQ